MIIFFLRPIENWQLCVDMFFLWLENVVALPGCSCCLTLFPQLQFCITFTHTVNSIRVGCDFPRWGQNLLAGYMVAMLILFGNFYVQAYIRRSSKDPAISSSLKTPAAENGSALNGKLQSVNGELVEANGHVASSSRTKLD